MRQNKMPDAYIGREQAYVKHTILKTYLQRLFMIIGQGRESTINYVDCFAGPWKEEDDRLSDTSIGVSLSQMAECRQSLKTQFGKDVTFRALYIEKDHKAFRKLQAFLSEQDYPGIETMCLEGGYTSLLSEIVSWCNGHFSFFFVDPTGWQQVVGAKTMRPLLQLGKAEFMINLMYDFLNRAVTINRHADDMIELFGEIPDIEGTSSGQRKKKLLDLYRENLNKCYSGRTAYVPVLKPGQDRVLYCLVYLTRHAKGIDVFKTESEKMDITQRVLQQEVRLRKQSERTGMDDLFGGEAQIPLDESMDIDNRVIARQYLLSRLAKVPTLIDNNKWADFLEESDLFPSDLQMAMKELISDGLVKNLDAEVSKRRTKLIKPGHADKSERWILV